MTVCAPRYRVGEDARPRWSRSAEVRVREASARAQLHLARPADLARFGASLKTLLDLRCFQPGAELLGSLAGALRSQLDRREAWQGMAAAVAWGLSLMAECGHPLDAGLHGRIAALLLPGPAAADAAAAANPAAAANFAAAAANPAAALTARQAQVLLRAWAAFACQPGSPARATLPAVLQALEAHGPLAPALGDPARCGGPDARPSAAVVLQRALAAQIATARDAAAVREVRAAAGARFDGVLMHLALLKLRRLCAPEAEMTEWAPAVRRAPM